ncbi:Imm50 family immunity protein [Kitasatospora sp. NPDC101155]|uniref:Imm50 family immunity protein n=1 Tax=Kitasatospora sp. NPDC101155 TaxID=3364097 RepID=UPI00382616A6
MSAALWPELLVHSERLTALYTELPPLERLVLRSVHLSPYGQGVKLRVELPRFPGLAPTAWIEAGCDRFEAQIDFMAVGEDLRMRGVPNNTAVDIDLAALPQIYERRVEVTVRGPEFLLAFTAHAALKAVHLNAYHSNDSNQRWFESPLDQRLHHHTLPPIITKTFYA